MQRVKRGDSNEKDEIVIQLNAESELEGNISEPTLATTVTAKEVHVPLNGVTKETLPNTVTLMHS